MKLTSPSFNHNGLIPSVYTRDGDDKNPPLKIRDVPPNTKSLVLMMDDPDALKQAGKIWDHWIVFNLPSSLTIINAGEQPPGVAGQNSWGDSTYQGPYPPNGEHHYFLRLYALDIKLSLQEGAAKTQIHEAMQGHIIEKTELVGRYSGRS